jgi:hypothetical protein
LIQSPSVGRIWLTMVASTRSIAAARVGCLPSSAALTDADQVGG